MSVCELSTFATFVIADRNEKEKNPTTDDNPKVCGILKERKNVNKISKTESKSGFTLWNISWSKKQVRLLTLTDNKNLTDKMPANGYTNGNSNGNMQHNACILVNGSQRKLSHSYLRYQRRYSKHGWARDTQSQSYRVYHRHLDKFNLVWWFDFRLEPYFDIAPKNTAHFKTGQKWHKIIICFFYQYV